MSNMKENWLFLACRELRWHEIEYTDSWKLTEEYVNPVSTIEYKNLHLTGLYLHAIIEIIPSAATCFWFN